MLMTGKVEWLNGVSSLSQQSGKIAKGPHLDEERLKLHWYTQQTHFQCIKIELDVASGDV